MLSKLVYRSFAGHVNRNETDTVTEKTPQTVALPSSYM